MQQEPVADIELTLPQEQQSETIQNQEETVPEININTNTQQETQYSDDYWDQLDQETAQAQQEKYSDDYWDKLDQETAQAQEAPAEPQPDTANQSEPAADGGWKAQLIKTAMAPYSNPVKNEIDTYASISQGMGKAINETGDLLWSTRRFATDVFSKGWNESRWTEQDSPLHINYKHKPQTLITQLIESGTQWATGFVGAGKGIGMLFTGKTVGRGAKIASNLAADAVANSVVFDRQEERLSNLIENIPALRNPVTNFLKQKPGESVGEAVVNMELEGLGLGIFGELLMRGLKCFKSGAKKINGQDNPYFNPKQYEKDLDELAVFIDDRPKQMIDSWTQGNEGISKLSGQWTPDLTGADIPQNAMILDRKQTRSFADTSLAQLDGSPSGTGQTANFINEVAQLARTAQLPNEFTEGTDFAKGIADLSRVASNSDDDVYHAMQGYAGLTNASTKPRRIDKEKFIEALEDYKKELAEYETRLNRRNAPEKSRFTEISDFIKALRDNASPNNNYDAPLVKPSMQETPLMETPAATQWQNPTDNQSFAQLVSEGKPAANASTPERGTWAELVKKGDNKKLINDNLNNQSSRNIPDYETKTSASNVPEIKTDVQPTTQPSVPPDRMIDFIKQASKADYHKTGVEPYVNLNHDIYNSPAASHIMSITAKVAGENTLKAAGKKGHAEVLEECLEFSEKVWGNDSQRKLLTQALADGQITMEDAVRVSAINRAFVHQATNMAGFLTAKVEVGTASLVDKARLVMLVKDMNEANIANQNSRTLMGRALNSRNININDELAQRMMGGKSPEDYFAHLYGGREMTDADAIKYLQEQGISEKEILAAASLIRKSAGDPAAVGKVLNQTKPMFNWWRAGLQVFNDSILSGPHTQGINVATTGLNVIAVKPLERLIGGAVTLDVKAVKSSLNMLRGMGNSAGMAFQEAVKAFKCGINVLDYAQPQNIDGQMLNQFHYERIKNWILRNNDNVPDKVKNWILRNKPDATELKPWQETLARFVSWIMAQTRYMSKFMVASDTFFKRLALHGQVYADLTAEAAERKLTGKQAAEYIKMRQSQMFDANNYVIRGDPVVDNALRFAEDATWTSPLDPHSLGGVINTAAHHPLVKIIIPFTKSPTNLFYDAMRHSPTTLMKGETWKLFKAGGNARAEALGRVATGAMVMYLAGSWIMSGRITAGPPSDPKVAALWREKGIKPYSINIWGKWREYRRLDPFATIISTVADAYNHVQENLKEGHDDIPSIAKAAIMGTFTGIMENLRDKTYLQGLADGINTFNDPDRYLEHFASKTAASFMPYSGFMRWIRNTLTDGVQRETKGIVEYMQNTLPFLSNNLTAKRSWISGDTVAWSGHLIQEEKDDMVVGELIRLGNHVLGAPGKTLHGVELTSEQYNRLCQLNGAMKDSEGKTMKDRLNEIMQSDFYDIERKEKGDPPKGDKNWRHDIVNNIIHAYRVNAQNQLLREYPDIIPKAIELKRRKAEIRGGVITDNGETAEAARKLAQWQQ